MVSDDAEAEGDDGPALRNCGVSRNFYNLMVLSTAFLLIFVAFSTAQSFAAPLLGDLGLICLCVLYVFFSLGGLVAPYIVRRWGTTTALWTASVTYAIFVAAFVYQVTPVLLFAAALNGLLGNVLWTAHGMMLTSITTEQNKGNFMSIFFGILGLHLIPGNIASTFLLSANGDDGDSSNATGNAVATTTTTAAPPDPLVDMAVGWSDENSVLFLVLAIIGSAGVLVLFLFKPPDPRFGSVVPADDRPLAAQVGATVGLLFSRKLQCLIPLFVCVGVHLVMWASWFPRQMYKTQIGLVMPCFGIAVLIGGLTVGKMLDRYGYAVGMLFAWVCGLVAFLCLWYGNARLVDHCELHAPDEVMPCEDFDDYGLFFAAAVFFGFGDCTMQSLCGAICSKDFAKSGHTADAFALKWGLFGIGAMVCFVLSIPLSVEGGKTASTDQLAAEIVITAVSMMAALAGLLCFTAIQRKEAAMDGGDNAPRDTISDLIVNPTPTYTEQQQRWSGGSIGSTGGGVPIWTTTVRRCSAV